MIERDQPNRSSGKSAEFDVHSAESHAFGAYTFAEYRAPRGHLESVVRPGFERSGELIAANALGARQFPSELFGLRESARSSLIRDARKYTSAYRDVSAFKLSPERVVMAGHQPTLFHPGVWFKNFALDRIAAAEGALAVNLVVDSDVAGPSSLRVPQRKADDFGYTTVPYDRLGGGVPYEQTLVRDLDLFGTFDARVVRALGGLVADPLVTRLWEYGREAIQRCGYAGCALAQARHRLEADFGLATLEIPQSVVCRSESFARFAMQILKDLPRFHACYNAAADFYREAHGIRSSAHPVPNLGREGEWFETPFWVYGNASPNRRGLWVRTSNGGASLELSDRASRQRRIDSLSSDGAAEAFAALSSPEFKIRSRALVTTMYARLVLSDLFLHGIGGGKYDQLGDLITRSFWGITPPQMQVLSATVLLPGHRDVSPALIDDELAELTRRRRDLRWQPERFADQAGLPQELLEEKAALLRAIPPRGKRAVWHRDITEVNVRLSALLEHEERGLRERHTRLLRERKNAAIVNSREHSFCLYPEAYLRDAFDRMLQQ